MRKVQCAIKAKIDDYSIDIDAGAGKLYMSETSPWKYLWAYAESLILNGQLATDKYLEASRKGRKTRIHLNARIICSSR